MSQGKMTGVTLAFQICPLTTMQLLRSIHDDANYHLLYFSPQIYCSIRSGIFKLFLIFTIYLDTFAFYLQYIWTHLLQLLSFFAVFQKHDSLPLSSTLFCRSLVKRPQIQVPGNTKSASLPSYARSPRMRRTNWMAHRFVSSKSPTRYASPASWNIAKIPGV